MTKRWRRSPSNGPACECRCIFGVACGRAAARLREYAARARFPRAARPRSTEASRPRPPLGFGFGDVARAAKRVDAAIVAASLDEVDVVGHSLGGLVATELLKNVDCGVRVRRVITLGTPHAGVPLARYAAIATLGLSPCMRQLVPGSRLLVGLAARPVPTGSELVAITGDADALVPERSSCIATATQQRWLQLHDVDHMQLLFHRDALALVGELLGAADSAPSRSRSSVQRVQRRTRRGVGRAVEAASTAMARA